MKKTFVLVCALFSFTLQAHALRFDRACDPGDTMLIGAVGDVLLHQPLQQQGYAKGFDSIWGSLNPFFKLPDVMYANYEGPSAEGVSKTGKLTKDPGRVFQNNVYSGYPKFNYHRSSTIALKASGFDVVSTANNHAMDRGDVGALRTISAMEDAGLEFFGTRRDSSDDFNKITEQNGWRIAWIACTFSTNGLPDKKDLVLDCFDTGRVSTYIKQLKSQVDAVIVTPHWGNEYQKKPHEATQVKFGRRWLDDGATAVIGSHPHVTQHWEKYKAADGREGLILYSLGNFVSNQDTVDKQTSLILFLGLTKKNGQTWVNGVRYVPLFMQRNPWVVVAANTVKPNGNINASLKIIKSAFGEERIVEAGEQVVTNAECY